MTAPSPHDAATLEPVTARAWRAVEEARLGAWRLNASLGFSGRINACWPMGPPGLETNAAITAVEGWYAQRGLPAQFKIADGLCTPTDLPARLSRRGYAPGDETVVMTSSLADRPDLPEVRQVRLRDCPDADFATVFAGLPGDPEEARERLEALARTPAPRVFALAVAEGRPAAIGACAVEAPWVGIFAMRTLPSARRGGLARRILSALLARAGALGARTAWLQVEAVNAGARRLYETEGFAEAYRYRYWSLR